jgi:hypothetical protein
LISNRITWGDTPIVTSPFPALDEIDQLIPVQRRQGDEHQPLVPGAPSCAGFEESASTKSAWLRTRCKPWPQSQKPEHQLENRQLQVENSQRNLLKRNENGMKGNSPSRAGSTS